MFKIPQVSVGVGTDSTVPSGIITEVPPSLDCSWRNKWVSKVLQTTQPVLFNLSQLVVFILNMWYSHYYFLRQTTKFCTNISIKLTCKSLHLVENNPYSLFSYCIKQTFCSFSSFLHPLTEFCLIFPLFALHLPPLSSSRPPFLSVFLSFTSPLS